MVMIEESFFDLEEKLIFYFALTHVYIMEFYNKPIFMLSSTLPKELILLENRRKKKERKYKKEN